MGVSTLNGVAGLPRRIYLGYPGTRRTFDEVVAGLSPLRDYRFGSSASGGTPIRNLTDLGNFFYPQEDFTGNTTINSELEIYPASFNSTNFVFSSDKLELTGVLESGSVNATITQASGSVNHDGTATAIANLGLANTSGIQVGQLVAHLFSGLYYVSAIVANTSVSLTALVGSPTAAASNNLLAWLPMYRATLSAGASQGATSLSFSSLPAGVTTGMSIMKIGSSSFDRSAKCKVTNISGNDVTLDVGVWETLSNGQAIAFVPTITSGQLWSKDGYSGVESGFFAAELECDLPPDAGSQSDILAVSGGTLTNFNTISTSFPWGAWPAFWMYSKNDGAASNNIVRGISEIDVTEMWYDGTKGTHRWTGFNHSEITATKVFEKGGFPVASGKVLSDRTILSWNTSSVLRLDGSLANTTRRFGVVWTPEHVVRYIDGYPVSVYRFDWIAQSRAQIGLNLAVGSIDSGYAANFMIPFNNSNMANQKFGLKRLRIYQ